MFEKCQQKHTKRIVRTSVPPATKSTLTAHEPAIKLELGTAAASSKRSKWYATPASRPEILALGVIDTGLSCTLSSAPQSVIEE